VFVDYAGKKPTMIEATTGEVITVELFVAVLGASNYTYAEATRTQQVPDWVASHHRAFQFFGGDQWIVLGRLAPESARVPAAILYTAKTLRRSLARDDPVPGSVGS